MKLLSSRLASVFSLEGQSFKAALEVDWNRAQDGFTGCSTLTPRGETVLVLRKPVQ